MPVIIRRLDAATDALSELMELMSEAGLDSAEHRARDDARMRLRSDLQSLSEYLERSTWWKGLAHE